MIKGRHIRAGRAWLGWDLKDLGSRTGLNPMTISRIERSAQGPEAGSLEKIEAAFARESLFFTESGIDYRPHSVEFVDNYMKVLDDIDTNLVSGDEVLLHCADDRRSTKEVEEKVSLLRKKGINFRLTISDENDFISGPPKEYRKIPDPYFASADVSIVYKNCAVLHIEEKGKDTFMIFRSPRLAEVMRKQFEYWWKHGKILRV